MMRMLYFVNPVKVRDLPVFLYAKTGQGKKTMTEKASASPRHPKPDGLQLKDNQLELLIEKQSIEPFGHGLTGHFVLRFEYIIVIVNIFRLHQIQ